MSRGFLCTLGGIAITIFAWFSPWLWPGWPALAMLDLLFPPERPFVALSEGARQLVVALLICWNVAFWSGVLWAFAAVGRRVKPNIEQ